MNDSKLIVRAAVDGFHDSDYDRATSGFSVSLKAQRPAMEMFYGSRISNRGN